MIDLLENISIKWNNLMKCMLSIVGSYTGSAYLWGLFKKNYGGFLTKNSNIIVIFQANYMYNPF